MQLTAPHHHGAPYRALRCLKTAEHVQKKYIYFFCTNSAVAATLLLKETSMDVRFLEKHGWLRNNQAWLSAFGSVFGRTHIAVCVTITLMHINYVQYDLTYLSYTLPEFSVARTVFARKVACNCKTSSAKVVPGWCEGQVINKYVVRALARGARSDLLMPVHEWAVQPLAVEAQSDTEITVGCPIAD